MISEDYNIQYMSIKRKIRILKIKYAQCKATKKNISIINTLDNLSKELDQYYIDEQYLDNIDYELIKFNK